MAVTICPWCQSEIPQEEGAEPESVCPVCENELGGYRTLRVAIESPEEEEEAEAGIDPEHFAEDEVLSWAQDGEWTEKNEALLRFEETVEGALDGQDAVPECPHCREYMLEAGELQVTGGTFRPRVPESIGEAVLEAPFSLTVYVCPSCFAVQHSLAENARNEMARRLSRVRAGRGRGDRA